jgi:hypothetical protein
VARGAQQRVALFQTPQAIATATTATPQPLGITSALKNAFSKVIEAQSGDENKHDFNWQIGSGATRSADFKEEVLNTEKILAFGIVKSGSSTINVIHGLRKYYNGNVATDLRGKVLGRIGDWTHDATPYIIEMQPEATWKWEKISIATSVTAWTAFVNSPQNTGQPWAPGETADPIEANVQLPRMIYLPPVVARFMCEGEPKTAHQMFTFVGEVVNKEGSNLTEVDATLLRYWCLAAGQIEPGKTNSSSIAMKPEPVVHASPAFHQWAKRGLTVYLGEGPSSPVTQQPTQNVTPPGYLDARFEDIMARHTNSMVDLASIHSKNVLEQSKKKEEGRTLDEYDVAALKGWCGVEDISKVPAIWPLFKASKSIVHARSNIMNGMKQWSETMGVEISSNILLTEDQIKDIIKMEPNPSGCVGTSKASDRGVSNMMCLPRTIQEIAERLEKERIARETQANRTMIEAVKLSTSSLKEPPYSYCTLKLNLATLAALLFVLYGVDCELYVKVLKVYEILKLEEVSVLAHKYTPYVCRTVTWAIYDDCRSFFYKRLTPRNFLTTSIRWPHSLMDDIMADVRFVRPIYRPTFPVAWDEVKYDTKKEKPEATQQDPPSNKQLQSQTRQPERQLRQQQPGEGDYSHMHPKLRAFFELS